DPVMENTGIELQALQRLPAQRALHAVETLRIQSRVSFHDVVPHAERAVKFIERWQAEAGAGGKAELQIVGHWVGQCQSEGRLDPVPIRLDVRAQRVTGDKR